MINGKIDWDEIRQRLDAVRDAIEKGVSPGPDEKKRILETRAEALAREAPLPDSSLGKGGLRGGDFIEIVEFVLANEYYGIESRYVREVYPIKDYTPLPGVPPFVLGLINMRGQIISVIDIKKFFDMPDRGISDLNKVIIIHDDVMEFGILADEILGVRNIALDQIQPPPPTLTGIREEYLRGVSHERRVILDAKRLLEDEKIIVREEI